MRFAAWSDIAGAGLMARLAKGGASAFVASIILLALPVMGLKFLNAHEYALWALLATIMTAAMVVDFGGAPLIQQAVGAGTAARRTLLLAMLLSAAGTVTVAVPAWLLWPIMVDRFSASGSPASYSVVLLLVIGCALRSGVVVIAAEQLAQGRFQRRGAILIGQALLQAVATTAFLVGGWALSALALGLLTSSVVCLAAFLPGALLSLPGGTPRASVPVSRFVVARGAASLISLIMTQGDRWALATVADADLLRSYDVAARFALVPKAVVTVFFVGLVNEAARAHGSEAQALLSRAKRSCSAALLFLSLGSLAVALPFAYVLRDGNRPVYVILVVAILSWSGVHALTGPVTLVLTGRGRPEFELHYLVPCFLTVAVAWWAGIHFSNEVVLIAGTGLALAFWSGYLLWKSDHYLSLSAHPRPLTGASRDTG